jgi:hypothetical protein
MKPLSYSIALESFAGNVLIQAVLFGFPPNLASHLGRSPLGHNDCYARCGRAPNLLRQLDRKFRVLVRNAG